MPIYKYTPVFKKRVIWKYTQQIYLLFSSYLFDEEIKGVYISDIFSNSNILENGCIAIW